MRLTLLLGRSGSGKTSRMLNDIAAGTGKRVLIVPQQQTFQAERSLAQICGGGFIGVEIFSLARLSGRILTDSGQGRQAFIDAQGKALMMARVLQQEKQHLPTLGRAAHWPGFARLAAELAAEMKKYCVSPQMLDQAAAQGMPARVAARARESAHLIAAYQQAMQGHFIDGEDAMEAMIALLPQSDVIAGADVYFDGFDAFTPQIRRAVGAMMPVVRSMCVALSDDETAPDADIFSVERFYAHQLIEEAQQRGIPIERIQLPQPSGRPADLAHLERTLFCMPPQPYQRDVDSLALWDCANEAEQAERVAQDIARRVREEGLALGEIGIVLPPGGGGAVISRALTRAGLAHFLDEKRMLLHHPLCELARAALLCAVTGFKQDAVLRAAKTGLAGIELEDADRLENHALYAGLNQSGWLKPVGRVQAGTDAQQLEQLRTALMQPLVQLQALIKNGGTALSLCSALHGYLIQTNAMSLSLQQADAILKSPADEALSRAAQEARQAAGVMIQLLDQLAATAGEQPMTTAEFARLLDAGLYSRTLGVIPTTLDQVQVGEAERVAAVHPKVVYVLTLTDEAWSSMQDTALMGGEDRVQLEMVGVRLGRSAEFRRRQARFALYRAFACARQALVLSTLRMQGGRAVTPALVLSDVRAVFPTLLPKALPEAADARAQVMIQTPGGAWRQALTGTSRFDAAARAWYRAHPPWDALVQTLHAQPLPKQGQAQTSMGISVSRLETFAACPYRHFAAYTLGASERDVFVPAGDASAVGSAMHGSMEGLEGLVGASGGWGEITPDQAAAMAEQAARAHLEGERLLETPQGRQIGQDIVRLCRRTAGILHRQHNAGSFAPIGGELAFGAGAPQALPPIQLPYEGGTAYLAGRIDRADIFEDEQAKYVRIVDYKSGFTEESLGRIALGLELQLPLYLQAVCEAMGASPAGFFHYRFDDPLDRGEGAAGPGLSGFAPADRRVLAAMDQQAAEAGEKSEILPVTFKKEQPSGKAALSPQDFMQLLHYARSHAGALAGRIAQGYNHARPVQLDERTRTCDTCAYRAACRFDPALEKPQSIPGEGQARRMMGLSQQGEE